MPSMITSLPPNSVILRFGPKTPFWPLTMSYGMFHDPTTRINFISPDHYVGYHMVNSREARDSIMSAPNGYIAWKSLQAMLADVTRPCVREDWDDVREQIMRDCLRLKLTQSSMAYDLLMKTGDRPIFDDSRSDEEFWCYAQGRGENVHGRLLEEFRAEARQTDPRYAQSARNPLSRAAE